MANVQIENRGGNCPVQIDGTVDGNPFYFRARGQTWTWTLSQPGSDPVDVRSDDEDNPNLILHLWGYYGDPDNIYAAGWMEIQEADKIFQECVVKYQAGLRGSHQHQPDPLQDALRIACSLRHLELMYGKGESLKTHFPDDYAALEEHLKKHPEIRENFDKQKFGWVGSVENAYHENHKSIGK